MVRSLNLLITRADMLTITESSIPDFQQDGFTVFTGIFKRPRANGYFDWVKIEAAKYQALELKLNVLSQNYDVFVFRYPFASYYLKKLSETYKHKIIFEHNTFELDEIMNNLKNDKPEFSFLPSRFCRYLESSFYRILSEKFFTKRIFRNAKGGIAVTKEIAEYEQKKYTSYSIEVISNSVDVDAYPLRKVPEYTSSGMTMLMLLGARVDWHGTDRIINSIHEYYKNGGEKNIVLHVVGHYFPEHVELVKKSGLEKNIFFSTFKSQDELNRICDECHLSLGSLAAFRAGLNEMSSLKVRESIARGFPMLTAVRDADLNSEPEFKPYFLQFPNNASFINLERVFDFMSCLYLEKDFQTSIRSLAMKYVDTKVKSLKLVKFIDGLN